MESFSASKTSPGKKSWFSALVKKFKNKKRKYIQTQVSEYTLKLNQNENQQCLPTFVFRDDTFIDSDSDF